MFAYVAVHRVVTFNPGKSLGPLIATFRTQGQHGSIARVYGEIPLTNYAW